MTRRAALDLLISKSTLRSHAPGMDLPQGMQRGHLMPSAGTSMDS